VGKAIAHSTFSNPFLVELVPLEVSFYRFLCGSAGSTPMHILK
jgi:hypothetical protein